MTHELIIEGQHVDLAPDTDITLEFVNDIIGDIGKINLSHSYSIKIPKTLRNTKILDDPGNPGHESGAPRKFLNARYYQNGIDLIGPALAYILKTTPENYEITLVWSTHEKLQALSQSPATLNDLPSLPVLEWIGPNGSTPDYTGGLDTGGAVFAKYNAGLGGFRYPEVSAATHPAMPIRNLLTRILEDNFITYQFSNLASRRLNNIVVLAAPGRKPAQGLEIESGATAEYVALQIASDSGTHYQSFSIGQWQDGWDAPKQYGTLVQNAAGASAVLEAGSNSKHHLVVNLTTGQLSMEGAAIIVQGLKFNKDMDDVTDSEELLRAYFRQDASGAWYITIDNDLSLSGWPYYGISMLRQGGLMTTLELSAYNSQLPKLAVYRVHETIDPSKDNRFSIKGNLPDIKQWDFIKACMAMFGLAFQIGPETLRIVAQDELLSNTEASYDWTRKMDMNPDRAPEISYTLNGWAQANFIKFQEDTALSFEPNAQLTVEDSTIKEERDFFELPFAASQGSNAEHYAIKDGKAEEVDIEPRIFKLEGDTTHVLTFDETLWGEGLIKTYYTSLQAAVRKPILLTAHFRLSDIDLAQLNMTRTVYLAQYGQRYAILKIQTSNTELCKVELLQLP